MRTVCVVVGSRANYGSIKSAMRAIQAHPGLRLQVVAAASALVDRYGEVVTVLERDGFPIDARVHMLVEGGTPLTMAKSTGLGLLELPQVFARLAPDVVLTVGDRFETMATTLAATYMNIALAHTMGGEVSGNIDECIRHAVTKFAHVHFPACEDARERILRLGERAEAVHMVGCPRIDLVAELLEANAPPPADDELFGDGVGGRFSLHEPFLLVSQHPVTDEYGAGEGQITETLLAVDAVGLPALVFWPNPDAGTEDVARGIRKFRESHDDRRLHFFKNLPVETYQWIMRHTACVVGNSSSAIREGAFLGTPAVNVGSRQEGRQRGPNVLDVPNEREAIAAAIRQQVEHGPHPSAPIYGDGRAGERIAEVLANQPLELRKRITY